MLGRQHRRCCLPSAARSAATARRPFRPCTPRALPPSPEACVRGRSLGPRTFRESPRGHESFSARQSVKVHHAHTKSQTRWIPTRNASSKSAISRLYLASTDDSSVPFDRSALSAFSRANRSSRFSFSTSSRLPWCRASAEIRKPGKLATYPNHAVLFVQGPIAFADHVGQLQVLCLHLSLQLLALVDGFLGRRGLELNLLEFLEQVEMLLSQLRVQLRQRLVLCPPRLDLFYRSRQCGNRRASSRD